MRFEVVAALFMTLASAFLLYGLNYETRQLESRVHEQERRAEKARADIAVYKAERAHLARPARIEPFARTQGLKPADKKQFVREGTEAIVTGATPR